MSKNTNLKTAKKNKNDEFYTRYEDIEKEMKFYTDYLKGKWVYSSCDDYRFSQFKTYFVNNFHTLGLKHFTCTNYDIGEGAYRYDYDGQNEVITPLNGDGDFRSEECIEYLKQADVVVTNPPFSLFRQYVKQLMDYGKKFIIIGNQNAITYKDIFHYIKNNQLWMGCSLNGTKCSFGVPESYNGNNVYIDNGKRMGKINNACWFTNVPYVYERKPLILTKSYYDNPSAYPKYENFDAINVDKVADIPMDYAGCIGVPITFLFKYNPAQFEIIKFGKGDDDKYLSVNGKTPYFRILIKKKDGLTPTQFKILGLAADKRDENPLWIKGKETYLDEKHKKFVGMVLNGKATYARIIIKKLS